MTRSPRILLVSRHYWPHLTIDTAGRDLRLADALRRAGMQLEIWTPRFVAAWSDRFTHREMVVHRPLLAPRGLWAARRYARQVREWFATRGPEFDIWLASGLGEEWCSLLRSPGCDHVRKVLWHAGTGQNSDHSVWGGAWGRRRLLGELHRADSIVVSWASAQRELLGIGVSAERLNRIDIGVTGGWPTGDSTEQTVGAPSPRSLAAKALGNVNGDLEIGHDTLVIQAHGRMNSEGGMLSLSRAFVSLTEQWGDLRLWLIGDGPLRDTLHHHFRQHGVRLQVAMPGNFTDTEDLLRVANVLVIHSPSDSLDETLPTAVSAGVPLVVADSPDTRSFFAGREADVLWFKAGRDDELRAAIQTCLIHQESRREAARQLRRACLLRRPYQQTVSEFQQLFDQLMHDSNQLTETNAKLRPIPTTTESSRSDR